MNTVIKILVVIAILFSVGCVNNSQIVAEEEPQIFPEEENYYYPDPEKDKGVVLGKILTTTGEPLSGNLYLSENITYDRPELPPTISFSYLKSPRANVDYESGFFYFESVEPGENYVLTIITGPDEPFIVKGDGGEYPLPIIVIEGEITELGVITIDLP